MRPPRAGTAQDYVFKLAAVALTVFALHTAKPVILPLVLAVLVAFIVTPLVTLAHRMGLSRVPAVVLTLLVSGAAATGVGLVVGSQLGALVRDLPNHQQQIEAKIERVRGAGGPLSRLANMVDEISTTEAEPTSEAAAAPPAVVVRTDEAPSSAQALEPVLLLLEPIAMASLVLVLMIFVLIGREDMRSRLMGLLGHGRVIGTVRILDESSRRIGRYLLFQLLLNSAVGALFTAGLMLLDVPYAPLWGFLTAVLRFIPYVGSWISLLLPLSISFATAPGWEQPLLVLAYFTVLDVIVANIVEPLLFGHHTGVSPIALLVAAAFWAWVWGPVGLLVSTPLTVCLVVMGQHVPQLRTLALLLDDQPALPPHLEYYQRVLASGAADTIPLVVSAAAAASAVEAFDKILIPTLLLARADRKAGVLTAAEERKIYHAASEAIAPAAAADPTPVPAAPGVVVVGCPAHHESEELPVRMLAAVLGRGGHRVEVLTTRLLPADVVRQVGQCGAGAVVVSILPPGGLPQTAHLCRQLRAHDPGLVIVAARWGGTAKYDTLLTRLRRIGASYLTTSLAQTCNQLRTVNPSAGPVVTAVTEHLGELSDVRPATS